jgi:hypothetical protein
LGSRDGSHPLSGPSKLRATEDAVRKIATIGAGAPEWSYMEPVALEGNDGTTATSAIGLNSAGYVGPA